jgi:asparagine synthase (glutamine-hydrolysing)
MSGICGAWYKHEPRALGATLRAMTAGLSIHESSRPSQIESAPAGVGVSARFPTQQLYGNGRLAIAIDADLLNERELRKLVEADPRAADTTHVAALVAALYERFGPEFASKLRGAFSVILWDARARILTAAVDEFAIHRLVYFETAEHLLIASRIDALTATGLVPRDINTHALANVLNFSSNLGPSTIFRHVQRLGPGALLTASERGARTSRYWNMRYGTGGKVGENRLCEEMKAVVGRAVSDCCGDADFSRLGSYLSGGTDSSTVTGTMASMNRGRVHAFSIGFDEQPFDEMGYAKLAASRFGAMHHMRTVGPADCFEAVEQMARYFDEPFGNSSAIPTYFCAREAAQNGVDILLSGDGGDELFGGNERYCTDKIFEIYHDLPAVVRKGMIEPALRMLPPWGGPFGRARGYVRRANMRGVERFLSFQFLATHPVEEVFDPGFIQSLRDYSIATAPARYYEAADARDHLDRLLYVDLHITLADNDLPKVTCMSELAGIRTRFPFLHRDVAEFSGRIPAGLKVKRFDKRYLFKKAFADLLPSEIIHKTKHGFGIPVAVWMKSDKRLCELLHDMVSSRRARERGYFRRDFIDRLLERHAADDSTYYGDTLWTILSVEMWHRQKLDVAVGAIV